jgi:hypothetical protein
MKITVGETAIADILSDKVVFHHDKRKIWNRSGISLEARIAADKELAKRVDEALQPDSIKKYMMPVDPTAPTRCIDGRPTLGWERFDDARKAYQGPKVPGGTAHAALTQRIVDTMNIKKGLLFEDDIKEVVQRYKAIGIGFGGHADNNQQGWNTGCGAVDNINLILNKLQRPEPQEQLRLLTKNIIGPTYDGLHVVNEVMGRMLLLDALKPTYMPREGGLAEGEYLYKKTIVELLKKEAVSEDDTVPQLTGQHNEVAIVLNFSQDTTFDTDQFSVDHDNQIQVFGWDVWEVYEEARRLYPYDIHDTVDHQHGAIAKRIEHITVRVLLGIATTMVLTDGSLKLITVE